MDNKEYYLGLDMGTNSVGWAVTDKEYNILRAKGKDLWGVRLFDEAKTSEERRSHRVARRARQREITRNNILRDLFSDAINGVDPAFYIRLSESKYHFEDRSQENQQKFSLFNDKDYTDKDYFKEFPTIFHLRKELLNPNSDRLKDIRLVYLATLNLFSRRGHFLNDSLGTEATSEDIESLCNRLSELLSDIGVSINLKNNSKELEVVLGEQGKSRSQICENIANLLAITKKDKKKMAIIKAMVGLEIKLGDVFDGLIEEEKDSVKVGFRSNYEEREPEIIEALGDDLFEIIETLKSIHDIGLLSNIMRGHKYLSESRVEIYDEHKEDLNMLKSLVKEYNPKAYAQFFRKMKEGSYSAYVGSVNSYSKIIRRNEGKGRKQEDLYKEIKNILKDVPENKQKEIILHKMDAGTFLQKQLTVNNGVIPNQVHSIELRDILKNASKYHPFLNEKDETGISVKDKIVQLFEFRIPYYVGPLGQKYKDVPGYNVWAERKGNEKIYPWNFEEQVDLKKSAEKFINRMVKQCTYLSGENTLPKQSLMYEKYMVLNEINVITVNGQRLPVEVKQDLFNELYLRGNKVSKKRIKAYLTSTNIMSSDDELGGLSEDCKASLSSLGKFYGILGEDVYKESVQKKIENIIFWATVYGSDKKFVADRIKEEYSSEFSQDQLKKIVSLKFEGWGNLSKKFLEIEGANREDGVVLGLLQAMWETNHNLQELLSENFTYKETVDSMVDNLVKPLTEWTIDDLNGMYFSSPVKRMVWQTMKIVEELTSVLGHAPKKVFVEMTRGGGEKGDIKQSRKRMLSELYKAIGNETDIWTSEVEDKPEQYFRIKKVYLYYRQMGRCMYTGEPIDIQQLMNDNLYDIDHIYPRHFVKDDSIDNNLVLVKKEYNGHKSDIYPIESSIKANCNDFWKMLLKNGLINPEKYSRLIRSTPFTDEEKAEFINRQLVETSQGTKAITQILKNALPETEIVFSKAKIVSDFRNEFNFPKARSVNPFHHANDAYLNIVVGNTYNVKFTKNPLNFIRDSYRNEKDPVYSYNLGKMYKWDVKCGNESAWIAPAEGGNQGTISTVRKMMSKNTPLVTKMPIVGHGQITNATIIPAKDAKIESYLPIKTSDSRLCDVTRYGGTTSISTSGYCLLSYSKKGKEIRSLEAIPIYLGNKEDLTIEKEKEYFKKQLVLTNEIGEDDEIRINIPFVYQRSVVKINGYFYYLGGKTGNQIYLTNATNLILSDKEYEYVHKLEKALLNNNFEEIDFRGVNVISKEKNSQLYQTIVYKFDNSILKKRVGVVRDTIVNGKPSFVDLSIENQCKVLMSLINNISSSSKADLTLINGSSNSGILLMSKKISSNQEFKLISLSPTGLYKSEIDCLKI